ncbi:TetR/AcrR family transcriptional regulator [Microbacterium rhizomatis]|uniref:TetR/AcrR family transcriptional regulator n=1 Tax=Microbacterium rhizomatis TaxID=1631477 RepID=A0A5J5IYH3_9MICO|nr:TetR/AcrR family transcriptional regulator [Microbacterium rhizomatis]KAA9106496.1 TetR/AcrR family transcriptional regulator [Microbacterium rhizomatis]
MTQIDLSTAPDSHTLDQDDPENTAKPRLGRKRDHTRDPEILDAALEVLAETGYDGMTIDMVAARAKAGKATLYRRWSSKSELVLDAVACMKSNDRDLTSPPDTGTLRGDLIAMVKSPTIQESERKLKVMAGIVSMIARDPDLATAAREALVEPRAAANRIIFARAVARGEIPAGCDIETLCVIGPAMVSYRTLMLREPVNREFMIRVIDEIILPAAGLPPAAAGA